MQVFRHHVWNLWKQHFLRITPLVPYGNPLGWKQDPDLHGPAGPLQAEVPHDTASQQVPGEPQQTDLRTRELPPTCVAWGEKRSKLFYFIHFIQSLPNWVKSYGRISHLSTLFPQTVSHLSRTSPNKWSSFCVSEGSVVLSLMAFPERTVVSYTGCLEPRDFWNSCSTVIKR